MYNAGPHASLARYGWSFEPRPWKREVLSSIERPCAEARTTSTNIFIADESAIQGGSVLLKSDESPVSTPDPRCCNQHHGCDLSLVIEDLQKEKTFDASYCELDA